MRLNSNSLAMMCIVTTPNNIDYIHTNSNSCHGHIKPKTHSRTRLINKLCVLLTRTGLGDTQPTEQHQTQQLRLLDDLTSAYLCMFAYCILRFVCIHSIICIYLSKRAILFQQPILRRTSLPTAFIGDLICKRIAARDDIVSRSVIVYLTAN